MSRPVDGRGGFERVRRTSAVVGILGLGAAAVGGALAGVEPFFHAWLVGVLLVAGLAVGALCLALMHQLTGGQWGAAVERLLEAAARTVPWIALAFAPLLFVLPDVYPWARPGAALAEPRLAHKAGYLNVPFFIVRAAVYFAVWTLLASLLDRWSVARDRTADAAVTIRLRGLAAVGLMALALTVSFAAIDWIMSLEQAWYSTVFGAMVGVGWMLTALAFTVGAAAWLGDRPPLAPLLSDKVRIDLGSLLLSFVILWTYLAFVQFLIIWSGNLPEEVAWYVPRLRGGWQGLAIALVVGRFLGPLFVLLSRAAKRRRGVMAGVASVLVVTHWLDTVWLVRPAWHPEGWSLHWLDVVIPAALGALWLALFLALLERRSLVAWQDPALAVLVTGHVD